MECDEAELTMAMREERTLTSREEAEFQDHLKTCVRCRLASQTTSDDEWRWLSRVPQDTFDDGEGLFLPTVDPGVYDVERLLASGGMGRILRARDRRLARVVAIKEVLEPELQARFEREAMITARLQHPAIVPIYEAGTWPDGSGFYTMRLVPGGTLQAAITGTTDLAERLALLHHVIAMTEAVAYAHGQRIIHRDLKPSNVLVGALGETVVIDWGLAKELDKPEPLVEGDTSGHSGDLTRVGAVMGTPGFMAPEQARGDEVDERADVYALGSILYALLAGVAPYAEDLSAGGYDPVAITLTLPPRSIDELAPEAPRDLRAIVDRAMAREPADRYPTAREMAEELRRFESGQLIARQYGVRELVWRWIKRHRAAVSVGLIAAILLLAVGALAIVSIDRSRAAERVARKAAERARDVSEQSLSGLLEEQGRSAILGGERDRGLVYLAEALARGRDTTALRHLLAVATRDLDLERSALRPLPGLVSELGFRPDGTIAAVEDEGRLTLWKGASRTSLVELGGELTSARFDAGAASLVVVGEDRSIALWDVASGKRRWRHANVATDDAADSVAFDATGARVLFASAAGAEVAVLDVATGKPLAVLEVAHGMVDEVAFSPDGRRIAACTTEGEIRIWDATTYASRASWMAPIAQRRILFTDADHVLTMAKTDASLWTTDGKLSWVVSHDRDLVELAVSPAADLIATADKGGVVRTWTAAGRIAGSSHHSRTKVTRLRFSPDGELLLGGAAIGQFFLGGAAIGQLFLWDTTALDLVQAFQAPSVALAWSADGALLAASTRDDHARTWARPLGNQRARFSSKTSSRFAGDAVLSDGDDGLVLRARETGAETARLPTLPPDDDGKRTWQVSRDGRRLVVSGDERATLIELPTGRQVATFVTDEATLSRDGRRVVLFDFIGGEISVSALEVSKRIVTGKLEVLNAPAHLRVVDAATGKVLVDRPYPTAGPTWVAISPDGGSLAVARKGELWAVWDADSLTPRRSVPGSLDASEGIYDPTGRLVLFGREDKKVTIHHATTGAVLAELTTPKDIERIGFGAAANSVAFQYKDGMVEVYQPGTPRPRAVVSDAALGSFALTPDGARLATGHASGEIQVWDCATGQLLEVLRGHRKKVVNLEFSGDGRYLLADVNDSTASVWDVALDRRTPAEITKLAERAGWKLVDGALVPRR